MITADTGSRRNQLEALAISDGAASIFWSIDLAYLRTLASNENPGKPSILLGHSMGSFATQQFILDHSHSIDGLILSGSGALDCLARQLQSVPAGEESMQLMNAPFEPARTP